MRGAQSTRANVQRMLKRILPTLNRVHGVKWGRRRLAWAPTTAGQESAAQSANSIINWISCLWVNGGQGAGSGSQPRTVPMVLFAFWSNLSA
jgi:hypothetical protein